MCYVIMEDHELLILLSLSLKYLDHRHVPLFPSFGDHLQPAIAPLMPFLVTDHEDNRAWSTDLLYLPCIPRAISKSPAWLVFMTGSLTVESSWSDVQGGVSWQRHRTAALSSATEEQAVRSWSS